MPRRASHVRSSVVWVLLGVLFVAPRPAAQQGQAGAAQPAVPAGGQPLPPAVIRQFQQKFLQDLDKKAKAVTGKKAADGSFIDPNGNPISPNVVNGLILTKETFVSDVNAWIAQLEHVYFKLRLEEKRQLVQGWTSSNPKNVFDESIISKLTGEYSKFVHAAANAKDVHGQLKTTYQNNIKIAEELEKLERENPGQVATRSGMTAKQWRELAANSPYGWFITMRQRFYALLEQNKLLALKKDGKFLFQALNLDTGAPMRDYIDVLHEFLDAGIADAKDQKAKAQATNTIEGLLAFGGPKYSQQQAKAAALGKALGAKLPQLLISETTAVFEGISITTAENEEWWNTLKDLGLNVVAAGSILVPFGPLIAAGVAAIQIVRDGSDLVVTYLDEEEAKKAAPVNGYKYVITAEDRTAAAQDKFFITALTSSADLIGLTQVKNIKFVKGGAAAAGAADDVAKAAAKTAGAADAVVTAGASTLARATNAAEGGLEAIAKEFGDEVANGVKAARELGIPEAQVQSYLKLAAVEGDAARLTDSEIRKLIGSADPKISQIGRDIRSTVENAAAARRALSDVANLQDIITAARKAGVPEETIQTALTAAKKSNSVQGYTQHLAKDLQIAMVNERKGIFLVDREVPEKSMLHPNPVSSADELASYGTAVTPRNVLETPNGLPHLDSVAAKIEVASSSGNPVGATLTRQEWEFVRDVMAPHRQQLDLFYVMNPDGNGFTKVFNDGFGDKLQAFLQQEAKNGNAFAKAALEKPVFPRDTPIAAVKVAPPAGTATVPPTSGGTPAAGRNLPAQPTLKDPPKYGASSGAPMTGDLRLDPTRGNAVNPAGPKATADAAARAAGTGPYGPLNLTGITPDGVAQLTTEELSRITLAQFNALPEGPMKQAIAQQIVKRVTVVNEARTAALNLLKRDGLNVAAGTMATAGALNRLEKIDESSTAAGGKTIEQAANGAFSKQFGPNVPTETITNPDGSVTVKSKDGKKSVTTKKGTNEITGGDEYVSETYAEPEPEVKEAEPPNDTFHKADLDLRKYIEEKLKGDPDEWVPAYDEKAGTITYTNAKNGSKVSGRVQPDGGISNVRTSSASDRPTPAPAAPTTPADVKPGANALDSLGNLFTPDSMPGFFHFAPGPMSDLSPMLGGFPPMPSVQNIIITTDGAAVEIEISDFAARYAAPRGGSVMAALAPGTHVTLHEPAQPAGRPTLSIVATGASTGEVFKVQVTNAKGEAMRVVAPDGLVLEAVTTKPATAGPGAAGIEGYCLDFMKPPPPAGTQYRVASEATQKKFAPVRNILRASARAARDGLLHPDSDPRSYAQFVKQYALWTHLERWNMSAFGEAFVERTKKNFQALKRGWTKEVEQAVRGAIPGRWRDIQTVLQQANALASAAGGK